MKPPPIAFARPTNVGSTRWKTYSEIAGTFERSARMWAWAGRMPSVLMLSPTRVMIWPSIVVFIGARRGIGLMFGPRRISSFEPSSAGGMIIRSSMV